MLKMEEKSQKDKIEQEKDIERQNKELQRIRNHIIQMKKQLQE